MSSVSRPRVPIIADQVLLGSGALCHFPHQSEQGPDHAVDKFHELRGFLFGQIPHLSADPHEAFSFRRRSERNSQVSAKVHFGAQGVALDDVGFDGDRGSLELIEQRPRPRVVVHVSGAEG